MRVKKIATLFFVCCIVCAFQLGQQSLFRVPPQWPKPNYNFEKNPLNAKKIALGRKLFYDPLLSRDNTISCATCHNPFTAFAHVDHDLSHGIDDKIGTRNAPALMNLAWSKTFMWDGAINHLDMQALAPISNPKEMDLQMSEVVAKLQSTKKYPHLFKAAFGDSLISGEKCLKSLSQFMLTLISSNSRYDSVMRHQAVFTEQ